jgi:hypothetical protein
LRAVEQASVVVLAGKVELVTAAVQDRDPERVRVIVAARANSAAAVPALRIVVGVGEIAAVHLKVWIAVVAPRAAPASAAAPAWEALGAAAAEAEALVVVEEPEVEAVEDAADKDV